MIEYTPFAIFLLFIVFMLIISGIKVVYEYERGVRFTLGKYSGIMKPGLRIVIPVLQTWERVDLRTMVVDVPKQDVITKDNISLKVNAVLYYKVTHPDQAILKVEEYEYAVSQLAQTTMRDVIGEATMDETLLDREDVAKRILNIVDKATDKWGIKVEAVYLKDILLPIEMKRVMAKAAEAEREKKSVIIKAEGEKQVAEKIALAAEILAKERGALHLRTLQTLNDISSDQTNTIKFFIPIDSAVTPTPTMGSAVKKR